MKYSFIIPVFNRPDEVDELLESLTHQKLQDFEVIVVEDGSTLPCQDVCQKYASRLSLHYYMKENSGPGQSRNYGVDRARGEYVIILDSDVVLPEGYLNAVEAELQRLPADAFGGPDNAHPSFTDTQKAISYSMTAFFTTGGIRGGKKKLDRFYPRSFNMGVRREAYLQLGGFSKMRFGEDIDFSLRIFQAGLRCRLFPQAWVWHKRRTDFRKFFRQVYNSGIARINLYKRHPQSLKPVHLLPMLFTLGVIFLFLTLIWGAILLVFGREGMQRGVGFLLINSALLPIVLYSGALFIDSLRVYRRPRIALLCIAAAFVQLMGYGFGFLAAWWRRCLLGKDEFAAFEKTFYK